MLYATVGSTTPVTYSGVYVVHILNLETSYQLATIAKHHRNAPFFQCSKCCDQKSNMRPAQRFELSQVDLHWARGSARVCDLCDKTSLYYTCRQYKQDIVLTLIRFRIVMLFHAELPYWRDTWCLLPA